MNNVADTSVKHLELTDINNYRLNEINRIRDYLNNEKNERKDIIKKLNEYIVSFDCLDKIIAVAKNKLNTIDTLLFSALNNSKTSHEEFTNIITETNIYENIKENIKELTRESCEEEKSTTL